MPDFISDLPVLVAVGVNHRSAPVDVREKIHLNSDELVNLLNIFKNHLRECFIISTCNRTEIYGIAQNEEVEPDRYISVLLKFKGDPENVKPEHFFKYISCGAAKHLFRVATSVDSMVVGDQQIIHQLKEAYLLAQKQGSTGKILNQLCQKALHTGKKTKTETELFEGAVSISYAAVELSLKIYGELTGKSVLVIGAGETAELTAESLIKKRVGKIYITNRTKSKAEELLGKLQGLTGIDGEVLDFETFRENLYKIDIIISSTGSPDYVIKYDDVKSVLKKRSHDPILMIDIAVPRDIDPKLSKFGNVFLKNIDDLNAIVDTNFEKRKAEFPKVNEIIAFEVKEFLAWYHAMPLVPVFNYIRESMNGMANESIKELKRNVEHEISKLHECILNGCCYSIEKDISCQKDLINSISEFTKQKTGLIDKI